MIKEFPYFIAWTDAMTYENGFAGFIGYQSKLPHGTARMLWVIAPNLKSEWEAEVSADNMLEQIKDITPFGEVIYADGVKL